MSTVHHFTCNSTDNLVFCITLLLLYFWITQYRKYYIHRLIQTYCLHTQKISVFPLFESDLKLDSCLHVQIFNSSCFFVREQCIKYKTSLVLCAQHTAEIFCIGKYLLIQLHRTHFSRKYIPKSAAA